MCCGIFFGVIRMGCPQNRWALSPLQPAASWLQGDVMKRGGAGFAHVVTSFFGEGS